MRLIDAVALRKAMYHEAMEKDSDESKWESGCWIRYKMFERVLKTQPTIDPMKNKLQRALEGKTEEETYDFLSWLMFDYAKQYTDSRSAVIQWLREDGIELKGEEDDSM